MHHHGKWKPAEGSAQCAYPPPEGTSTHRDKHLVISFIVISVTVVHTFVAVTARENKVITPTHTVAGSGALAPLTSVF